MIWCELNKINSLVQLVQLKLVLYEESCSF